MSNETAYQLLDGAPIDTSTKNSTENVFELTDVASVGRPWWLRLLFALLWLEPFWVATLMPSLLFRDLFWDPWVQPWLVAALLLFWPLRLLVERRLLPSTPLNLPIFALLLWSSVGLWVAIDPTQAWQAEGYLVLGIALYVAFLNWPPTQQHPWLLVLLMTGCGLLLTLIGPELLPRVPSEFFVFSDEVTKSKPVNYFGIGELINPNVLAGGLLLPIPLLTALAIRTNWARRRWAPPLLFLIIVPILLMLILVQSRGSYLAVIVALMVVLTLRWPWAGVAMGVATITTAIIISWDGAVLFLEAFGSDGSVTSFSGRLEIWQATLSALTHYGLTGVGIGNFELVVPPYFTTLKAVIPHAHNLFLQIAVDLGIPGLLLYGWLLIQTVVILVQILRNGGYAVESALPISKSSKRSVRRRREGVSPRKDNQQTEESTRPSLRSSAPRRSRSSRRWAALRWALAAGLCAAFTGMMVHGLVDAVTWGTKLAFMPWLLYALAALLWLQSADAPASSGANIGQ